MSTTKTLLVLTLVVTAFFTQVMRADAAKTGISVSPALKVVLDQAGKISVKTTEDWKNLLGREPDMAAVFIGLIMQRQHILMQQYRNPDDITRYLALNNEIEQFLSHLAKTLNYRLPQNGSNLPPEKLHGLYRQARNGNMNAMFMKESGFDPTTANVPFMVRQVPLPAKSGGGGNIDDGGFAKLQMKEDENEINLLNEVSPSASADITPYEENNEWQTQNQPIQKSVKDPITGCSNATFTFNSVHGNRFTISTSNAYAAIVDFGDRDRNKNTIWGHIHKLTITYSTHNGTITREVGLYSDSAAKLGVYKDTIPMGDYTGSIRLVFKAYDYDGNVLCTKKLKKTIK